MILELFKEKIENQCPASRDTVRLPFSPGGYQTVRAIDSQTASLKKFPYVLWGGTGVL